MPSFLLEAKTGHGHSRRWENNQGWETKTLTMFFRLKRRTDETWVEYHGRTCHMVRKVCVQMGLPVQYENCGKYVARHGVVMR